MQTRIDEAVLLQTLLLESWARLIQKIYEVDPMICPRCSSEMRVIAIITSEYEVRKILRHLWKPVKAHLDWLKVSDIYNFTWSQLHL